MKIKFQLTTANYKLTTNQGLPFEASAKEGFTLLETLIVLSLITLAGVVSYFAYQQHLDKQKLQQNTELIISYTQTAQNDSVLAKQGKEYGIQYDVNQLTIIQYHDPDPVITQKPILLPSSIQIQPINLSQNPIRFAKLTGKPNSSGDLTVNSRYYQITISIDSSGQINQTPITKK